MVSAELFLHQEAAYRYIIFISAKLCKPWSSYWIISTKHTVHFEEVSLGVLPFQFMFFSTVLIAINIINIMIPSILEPKKLYQKTYKKPEYFMYVV